MTTSKGNIVLVHGAWANAASWDAVIERLQASGYNVTAPNFALGAVDADVAQLRRILSIQAGPTLVVGHSYGGVIMSALGSDVPNLAGLVFVAAFGLDQGESVPEFLGGGSLTAERAHLNFDSHGYAWMPDDDYLHYLAADVDPVRVKVMSAGQQPVLGSAFARPMVTPSWKNVPTWYVVATNDRDVPPAAQRMFAARMGATVLEVPSSHVVLIAKPDEVAAFIISAAKDVLERE